MVTLERDFSRDRARDRRAQSLLEVIPEQNVERMRGKEIHSVVSRQTRKKEGGETDY